MSVRVPRPRPGCDIRKLPLTPSEAFLLTRIDGVLSERELEAITGMSQGAIAEGLDKLRDLGAIDIPGEVAAQRVAPRAPAAPPPRAPSVPPPPSPPAAPPAAPTSAPDPAVLAEEVDLTPEKKRRILDLYARLEHLTHYELLGVAETADKKQIKAAYYALAPEFHPDSYFRKQLGSYKQRIEAIFNRVTVAHDVLTSKDKRAEYDEYLVQTRVNEQMAALIEGAAADIASITSEVDESARAIAVGDAREGPAPAGARSPTPAGGTAPPAPPAPGSPRSGAEPGAPPTRQSSPSMPAMSLKERRELLARKLGGALRRPSSMTMQAVKQPSERQSDPGPSPESVRAAEELKTRYDQARAEALRVQIDRYLAIGRGALDRKDFASAANAYRIAASLAPEDEEVQRSCAEVQQLAAAALAEGYLKQAQYEETHERWEDAALSYAKVCAGRPDDPRPHERAAFTMLKAGGNTRRAVEFARRAVELSPEAAELRLTLARAYAVAGLEKSALGELTRAADLSKGDARVRELVAQARDQIRHGKPI